MYMESSYLSFIVILFWFMQPPPPNVTVAQVPTYTYNNPETQVSPLHTFFQF